MKKTLFVVLVSVMLLLTACKTNGMFSSDATQSPALAIETGTPTPTAVTCVDTTPQATSTTSACIAAFNASNMTTFSVNNNMDVGDPALWSVVFAHNELDQYFVAVIEPKYNLDFEATVITGSFMQSDVNKETALCAAKEMMAARVGQTSLVYVGASDAPDGWSTASPAGWKMSTTMYTEDAIVVAGSDWKDTISAAVSDTNHLYGDATLWNYGQLWDGVNDRIVYHFIVEPGYVVTTANLQGTIWPVGVDATNIDQLLARFAQMSAEVDQRDDHPVIIKIYVGENTPPTGWSKDLPTGWTSSKR